MLLEIKAAVKLVWLMHIWNIKTTRFRSSWLCPKMSLNSYMSKIQNWANKCKANHTSHITRPWATSPIWSNPNWETSIALKPVPYLIDIKSPITKTSQIATSNHSFTSTTMTFQLRCRYGTRLTRIWRITVHKTTCKERTE